MIQAYTRLNVADNSGAKSVMCIKLLGGSKKKYGAVGDIDLDDVAFVDQSDGSAYRSFGAYMADACASCSA